MSGFYMKCHTGNTKIDWSDLKENFFYDVGIVMVFLNLIVVLTLSLLIKLPLKIVDLICFKFLFSKILLYLCVTHGLVFLITTGYVG